MEFPWISHGFPAAVRPSCVGIGEKEAARGLQGQPRREASLGHHVEASEKCWIQWIGLRENLHRKPWFLPWNTGVSCVKPVKIFPSSNSMMDR